MVRLDALIGEVLGVKVAVGRALVEAGEVTVDGEIQTLPQWQVVLNEAQRVCLRGELLGSGQGHRQPFKHKLLLVHKPRSCVCERFRGSAAWCNARGSEPGAEPPGKEAASLARGVRSMPAVRSAPV